MLRRIGIIARLIVALLVSGTVLVPVAAQAATCSMPSCSAGCCMMNTTAARPGHAMTMGSCCSHPGPTLSQSSCPTGSQRPDFKATAGVPEVIASAVPLGATALIAPTAAKGGFGIFAPTARSPGDQLAGTRLRI